MYLEFKSGYFYPEDYEDFESFWKELPKNEDGELENYKPEVDFIEINDFSLSYPVDKENVQELYNFMIKLDSYAYKYDDINSIIYGLYLWFDYNLSWRDLGNISDEIFWYIENRFAYKCDSDSDMVYEYLDTVLGLNKYQLESVLKYFESDSFIEDNFAVNGFYYYYLD